MRRRIGERIIRLALLCHLASPALAGEVAPTWLTQAAAAPLPAYDKKVPAVVLLDEGDAVVDERGRVRRTARYVVRVLNREGRDHVFGHVPYATDTSEVRSLDAWLVSPTGTVKKYGKKDWVDHVHDLSDVYEESRVKSLSARDDADVGSVFGFEAVVEEQPLFAHDVWSFQGRLPVVLSRYRLTLPPGGHARGTVFNRTDVPPRVAEQTHTWEVRDLGYVEHEVSAPPLSRIAPWLAVSYETGTAGDPTPRFADWPDVSRWYDALSAPSAAPDAALTAKAQAITRDARTDGERVRAIARYVQGVKYVSIQIGMGRFRPHAAAEVLAKSYGDCKDKANLMRMMLKAIGIEAYLVLIYSGDPDRVRSDWPSPLQFNHCIVAVALREPGAEGSTVTVDGLGPLLVFDPTDEYTPFGELPRSHQGSLVVVASPQGAPAVRLPPPAPEAGLLSREIEAELDAGGGLRAKVREVSAGAAAAAERRAFRGGRRTEVLEHIAIWISAGATAARVSRVEEQDDEASGRFTLEVEFTAPAYGQLMQQRLLVFRPAVLSRREWVFPSDATRTLPVALEADAFAETVRITLPAGFRLDELPTPVSVETPFGRYTAEAVAEGATLIFRRKLVLQRATVPAAEYASVRSFYEKMRAAEQAPVVLVRK